MNAAQAKRKLTALKRLRSHVGHHEPCHRCGGAGGYAGWPGFTCFRCGGKDSRSFEWVVERYWPTVELEEQAAFFQAIIDKEAALQAGIQAAEQARLQLERDHAYALQEDAERDAGTNAPQGRLQVTGEILGSRSQDWGYGTTTKILVKTTEGWKLWLTLPSGIYGAQRGDTVTFTVTVEPSEKDPRFAYGVRPTKASIVTRAPQEDA